MNENLREKLLTVFDTQKGLAEAIRKLHKRGEAKHATDMAVSKWFKNGVPPTRCVEIERASKGLVTRFELRPDIFGDPPSSAA